MFFCWTCLIVSAFMIEEKWNVGGLPFSSYLIYCEVLKDQLFEVSYDGMPDGKWENMTMVILLESPLHLSQMDGNCLLLFIHKQERCPHTLMNLHQLLNWTCRYRYEMSNCLFEAAFEKVTFFFFHPNNFKIYQHVSVSNDNMRMLMNSIKQKETKKLWI